MAKKKIRWDRIMLVALAVIAVVVLVWQLQTERPVSPVNDTDNQQTLIDPSTVYLTIGDREYTYGELNAQDQRLDPETRAFYSLDEFIEAGIIPPELLLIEASKSGVHVDEEMVDDQIEFISDMAEMQGMTFDEYVSLFGFTEEEARKQIRDEIMIQEFLDQKLEQNITVTDEEIMELYEMWGIEQQGLTVEEVRDDLEEMVRSEKYNDLVRDYIASLRENTNVTYHYTAGAEANAIIGNESNITEDDMLVVIVDDEEAEDNIKVFFLTGHMYYFADDGGLQNPELRVNEGDTVRLIFNNIEGIHDWVVDEIEGARTSILQPGQNEIIEFVATQAGEYEYYCSYMQHREMGMKGVFIVE
jgi:hypothetical protein